MSLSARLTAPPPPRRTGGTRCTVGKLRDSLPVEDQAALDRMIWDLDWTDRQVHQALAEEGLEAAISAIPKHRRRECRCDKAGA